MFSFHNKVLHKAKSIYYRHRCVLGRTACLGQDVFNLRYNTPAATKAMVNMQKVRADMFPLYIDVKNRPVAKVVQPFMLRPDVFPMIVHQEQFNWLAAKHTADTILIDSFSELTDQKFAHKKDGWAFCCNYTDIEHTHQFEALFDCHGLIELGDLEKTYTDLFAWLNTFYPKKKIVFFHFPTALDERDKFRERGQRILEILLNLEKKNKKLKNIFVDDDLVLPYPGDDFPYHYAPDTQLAFLRKWEQ